MNSLKSYNKRFTIQNFLQIILALLFVVVVTTCSTDTTDGGSGNNGGGSGNNGGGSGGVTTGAVGIAMEKVCTNKTMPDLNSADFSVLKPMLEPFSVTTNTVLNCIHFSESGSATDTGDSWANTLSTDQLKTKLDAISDASNSKVYILLLAKGTYTPTTLATDETARETSFTMKSHTAIIGGWNNAYDFNIETYTTLLSGDIGEENDTSDNSYHVILNKNTSANPLTSSAVLYGVTLSHGNANGTKDPYDSGGAIYNEYSHPTIIQLSFSNNSASIGGGAIFNFTSNPTISKSSFSNNSSSNEGGAIYNNTSHPTITQSSFSNNLGNFGGAIYNIQSNPTITQSSFSTNSSKYGGAILNQSSHPTITQSSFSTNSANQDGGAIYQNNDRNTGTTLANVILWGNTAAQGNQIYLQTDGKGNENLILGSVILQDGTDNIGFNPANPTEKQVSEHNILTTDPGLGAFANNGGLVKTFSILENSSAIDKGLYIKIKNDYSAFYYSSDSSTWYTTPVLAGTTTPLNTAVTPHTDSFKLATDARGYKFKGKPDIGDYEYNGIAPTP